MDNSFLVWSYMTDMSVIKNPLVFAFVPLEVDIENKHCSTGPAVPCGYSSMIWPPFNQDQMLNPASP